MGKIIFCALIIVGLCFGQGIWLKENPKINLPMPINGAIRSINPLSPNNLMMQVEGESLQPKTSFCNQVGIYGMEFVGASIAATLLVPVATICIVEGDPEYWHYEEWPIFYAIGNSLLTSSCTWGIGKLLYQKGTWWKSAIGAGLGGIISGYYLTMGNTIKEGIWTWIIVIGLPASGAVLGFNL